MPDVLAGLVPIFALAAGLAILASHPWRHRGG